MKIKEALDIINNQTTMMAKYDGSRIHIYDDGDPILGCWFLFLDGDTRRWEDIGFNPDCLGRVSLKGLKVVLDTIQQLLDTPVEDRLPEKKYYLCAMRCVEGPVPIKQYVNAMNISSDNVEFRFTCADCKDDAMEFTQGRLDTLSEYFPEAALNAMKEEVKNDAC